MTSTNLAEKIANEYNATISSGDVKFTCGDSDFVFTDGTIYTSVDGKLSAGCKKVKTLKAAQKFVALRA